jgi:hypothetical protein
MGIPELFFYCPEPGCFLLVLNPEKKGPVAGFGEREDDEVTLKTDGDGGKPDDVDIKDLESGLDIDKFLKVSLDIIPGFLERGIPENDLVIHRLYASHGFTSSITFFRGRGLCTALAAMVVQGNSIFFICSS